MTTWEQLQAILKRAFPDKSGKYAQDYFNIQRPRFETFQKLPPQGMAKLLEPESLSVKACVLAYLDPALSAQVLKYLSEKDFPDLLIQIAQLGEVSTEWLDELDSFLEQMANEQTRTIQKSVGGIEPLVKMLQSLTTEEREAQLSALELKDQNLAKEIRDNLFVFRDLIQLSDSELRELISKTNNEDWILAFRTAPIELRNAYSRNVSQRVAKDILERLNSDPQALKRDVEAAQKRIVNKLLGSS